MTAHAANPVYDAITDERRLEPLAWAALIKADIESGRDHTGGRPWPTWSTTPIEVTEP